MIIDAMDMLYTSELEGFCLVSSDSDFTKLASRLRESGKTVIGMGEGKTPSPFRKACDILQNWNFFLKIIQWEKKNVIPILMLQENGRKRTTMIQWFQRKN